MKFKLLMLDKLLDEYLRTSDPAAKWISNDAQKVVYAHWML